MKKLKNFLRVWIAGASVAGFIFGWATFAHANKPVALAFLQNQTTTQTASAGSTLTSTQASNQTLQSLPQTRFSASPRLRTGGS